MIENDKEYLSSKLLNAIRTKVDCNHPESAAIFYNGKFRRAVEFKCEKCRKQLFIKCFGNDNDVSETKKKIRCSIERNNIIYFSDKSYCSDSFRSPNYIGSIGAPHYSIIEEYIEYESFLSSLISAILDYGNKTKLVENLASLARHMAEFHNEKPSDEDLKELKKIKHKYISEGICKKIYESGNNMYIDERLCSFHERWIQSQSFKHAVEYKNHVHGNLSAVNLLFSDDEKIRVLDFETLHINTPFVDIGTITAELKLAFYVYGADNYQLSESFISFFLREYYIYSNMNLNYRQFTFAQASYYMGLQLLNTHLGNHFDQEIRRWCVQITSDIWKLIESESDFFTPPFIEKKGICFDFYNTLVRIVDDESNIENFEMVRAYLIDKLGYGEHSIPGAIQLRDIYYNEKNIAFERKRSTIEHPDVDLMFIWRSIIKKLKLPDEFSTPEGEKKLIELLSVFRAAAIKSFEPIEDAVETLRILKEHDITVGILSDAQPAYFEREFLKSGLMNFVDFHVLSAEHGIRKPSKALFNEGLKHLELSPDEIVFVGDDMFRDIFGAKSIGMSTVYIPSEHGISYYEDCKPDEVIRSVRDLLLLFGIEKD